MKGKVVELLDENGSPFAAYRYDAWGNPLGEGNIPGSTGIWAQQTLDGETEVVSADLAAEIATRQVLRYASYCFDAESGMFYLSSRHYDPATRQFLSKDLSRNDGEQSAYQYCLGNPIKYVDPTGYSYYAWNTWMHFYMCMDWKKITKAQLKLWEYRHYQKVRREVQRYLCHRRCETDPHPSL